MWALYCLHQRYCYRTPTNRKHPPVQTQFSRTLLGQYFQGSQAFSGAVAVQAACTACYIGSYHDKAMDTEWRMCQWKHSTQCCKPLDKGEQDHSCCCLDVLLACCVLGPLCLLHMSSCANLQGTDVNAYCHIVLDVQATRWYYRCTTCTDNGFMCTVYLYCIPGMTQYMCHKQNVL